ADAFERYDNNKHLLEHYRDRILPDQIRVYRGVYERHQRGPLGGIEFNDVVTTQQTLAQAITTYLSILGNQWQAVVAGANWLQTSDLFGLQDVAPHDDPRVP